MKYLLRLAFIVLTINVNSQIDTQFKIDKLLTSYNTENSPGFTVRVVKKEDVIYSKSFGFSNLDYGIKNSDSTVYSIASISKQFTAAAVWYLIEQGKLSLDDDIRTYFPKIPNYNEIIKIRHLLNHTSGIRAYHTLMFLSGFDYNQTYYDNKTVLALACKQKNLNNKPGDKVIYGNTNYNILALLIEKISGVDLDTYLKQHILNPLKMNNTFVRVSHGKIIKNKAIGYQQSNDTFIYNVTNQLSYGAGSMGSTVLDMSKWASMLNGNVPEFIGLSKFLQTQEVLPDHTLAKYARGVMVDNYKGHKTISHSGYGFGGQTQLITVPEENISIIIFTNLQSINPTPISYQILDILLPEKELEIDLAESVSKITHHLRSFVGEFKEVNSDMRMTFTILNDTLKAKGSFGDFPVPLIATENNKFVRLNSQNVTYDFTKTTEADVIIYFGGTPFYFKRAKFIDPESVKVEAFTGSYYSEELNTTYTFKAENNSLILNYKDNPNIKLFPVQLNEFGNNNRTLYRFNKDKSLLFLSCDGTVKNIKFVKIE